MATDRFPADLLFTREHEWLRVTGDRGTVGITWFAQDQLGDVVFVELPAVGERLERDQPFGVVESVKTVSDLFAPVSGEVLEVNDDLEQAPERVNEDPYGDGWLVVVKIEDPDQLRDLLDPAAYRELVEGDE